MTNTTQRATFTGSQGGELAARLDLPAGPVRATAIFAHCFTCSKDIFAAKRIASDLARQGLAVLRFDFTGLGASDGDFANTNFSSNVDDLKLAADWLRSNYEAPSILVGHSLGGAAVLAVAGDIPEVKAVATIGAPSDAEHVVHNFSADLDQIEHEGEADVQLAGRTFKIRRQFLDDVKKQNLTERIAAMKKALMVMHSPIDDTVGIDNASRIFLAAKHPKSFVSLDKADHLLTRHEDAVYVADVISAWASRFVAPQIVDSNDAVTGVKVAETGEGKFQNYVIAGRHRLFADEPESVGGLDSGPSPYDYVAIGLASCTSMTLRLYAEHKKLDLGGIEVTVEHNKVHARDCEDCASEIKEMDGRIDRFVRRIRVSGPVDEALEQKLLSIADKCPVHKTLEGKAAVVTELTGS